MTVIVSMTVFATAAQAAPMPRHWHASPSFLRAALCLHSKEGAWNANTGNSYYGGLQFTLSTWQRAGGAGYPHQASPREQIYRCWRIYLQDNRSFREWGTRGYCHLS
jgi:hypothetical protein